MRKITPHAGIEIGLATLLLLGSCSDVAQGSASEAYDLADVARVNSVNALARTEELQSQVEALSSDLDSLRETVDSNANAANASSETWNNNAQILNRALDRLDRIEERLRM